MSPDEGTGVNRPASWSHLEVQRFAFDEGYVWDEERFAQGWQRYLCYEYHERIAPSSVRP